MQKLLQCILLITFAIYCVDSCCKSNIPWDVCNHIPVENAFVPKTCSDDVARSNIPCATREYYMRKALDLTLVAGGACPFNTFGAIIGRHTGPNVADFEVLCTAINRVGSVGATAHGEIEALRNCSSIIATKYGPSYVNNATFWQQLSMYTTGESCPMCMSAARFAKLGEVIYATSIETLHSYNWGQISFFNQDIQAASNTCGFGTDGTAMQTRIIKDVLRTVTDPYFSWQFTSNPCPGGCVRMGGFCASPSPNF